MVFVNWRTLACTLIALNGSGPIAESQASSGSPRFRVQETFQRLRKEFAAELAPAHSGLELRQPRFMKTNYAHVTHSELNVGRRRGPWAGEHQIALTLCHELGHLIGGAPRATGDFTSKFGSYAYEGQADYFAFSKCLKRLWREEDNESAVARLKLDPGVKPLCRGVYRDETRDWFICVRSIQAAVELARVYYADQYRLLSDRGRALLENEEERTPPGLAKKAVYRQSDLARQQLPAGSSEPYHPSNQCRLDTMVAGALCAVDPHLPFSDEDPAIGACATGTVGGRPLCWYQE